MFPVFLMNANFYVQFLQAVLQVSDQLGILFRRSHVQVGSFCVKVTKIESADWNLPKESDSIVA